MIVVNPIDFIKSNAVIASNVPSNDFAIWNASVTYQAGDKVTYESNNFEEISPIISAHPALDDGRAAPPV